MKNKGNLEDIQSSFQLNNQNNINATQNPFSMGAYNGFGNPNAIGGFGGLNSNPFMMNPFGLAQTQKLIDEATYKEQLK
jgi:hypothetical protein